MSRVLTINEVETRIFSIHGKGMTLDRSTYINTQTKARFFLEDGTEWWSVPNNIFKGGGPLKYRNDKLKIPVEEIKKRLQMVHGEKVYVDESTYTKLQAKARFVDAEYGEWWANAHSVLRGSGHPLRGEMKALKSSNFIHYKIHWKNCKELLCQGSYEAKSVDYFNENRIEFDWQPKIFEMPNGKTYRPDVFLPNDNKWIEIKGFFRKDAEEKWNWFKTQYPSAELWNHSVLKAMGIL